MAHVHYSGNKLQGCDLEVKNPEKWVAGLGLHLVSRTKPPEPPGCLILEDLQTLHIPTNKKLEVWTQYRLLLSFLGATSILSRKFRHRVFSAMHTSM